MAQPLSCFQGVGMSELSVLAGRVRELEGQPCVRFKDVGFSFKAHREFGEVDDDLIEQIVSGVEVFKVVHGTPVAGEEYLSCFVSRKEAVEVFEKLVAAGHIRVVCHGASFPDAGGGV